MPPLLSLPACARDRKEPAPRTRKLTACAAFDLWSSYSLSQTVLFSLRQQKFLEALERKETKQALSILRNELTPLVAGGQSAERLHFLSRSVVAQLCLRLLSLSKVLSCLRAV